MDSMLITDMASILVARISTMLRVVRVSTQVVVLVSTQEGVSTQVDNHHTQEVISSTLEAKQVEGGKDSLVEVVVEDILDRFLHLPWVAPSCHWTPWSPTWP